MSRFTESIVEEATLEWLEGLGYTPIHASEVAPDSPNSERQTYAEIFQLNRIAATHIRGGAIAPQLIKCRNLMN